MNMVNPMFYQDCVGPLRKLFYPYVVIMVALSITRGHAVTLCVAHALRVGLSEGVERGVARPQAKLGRGWLEREMC